MFTIKTVYLLTHHKAMFTIKTVYLHTHQYPHLLSMLQKRILRILTFSNYDVPSELLFRYTNILPLCKLVHYRICIMMYKYANGLLSPVINSIYTVNSDIHEHNTRQKRLLHTNKGSNNQFNKCISNISARVWNALQKVIDVNISASKFICLKRTFLNFHLMYFTRNEIAIFLCSYLTDHIYICKIYIY